MLAWPLDVGLCDTAQTFVGNVLKACFDPHDIFLKPFNKSEVISQRIETHIGWQFVDGVENMRAGVQ